MKKEKKLQKLYLTDYNFLMVEDLRQAHYQIFFKVLLKELIKLNVNMDLIIKNISVELHTKIINTVFNM